MTTVSKPTQRELQLVAAMALKHILEVTGLPVVLWHIDANGSLEGQALPSDYGRHLVIVEAFRDLLDAEPRQYHHPGQRDAGRWVEIRGIYLGCRIRVSGVVRRPTGVRQAEAVTR